MIDPIDDKRDYYSECCRERPFWREPGSGRIQCRGCFIHIIENRVRRTINRMKIIHYKSKIGVALSGGKDSTVLLHILSTLYKKRPDISLIALIIDEGIAKYRDESLLLAIKICESLQIPYAIESFNDLYNISLDGLINQRTEQRVQRSSCTICGVLRRRALSLLGEKHDVDVIATGHTLDDQVQTILLNILRGDARRFLRDAKKMKTTREIPRIKPLREVSERETTLYAFSKDLSIQSIRCPYSSEAMRNEVRQFFLKMENHHPTTMISTLKAYDKIMEALKDSKMAIENAENTCSHCDAPTSKHLCQTCRIIEELGIDHF